MWAEVVVPLSRSLQILFILSIVSKSNPAEGGIYVIVLVKSCT